MAKSHSGDPQAGKGAAHGQASVLNAGKRSSAGPSPEVSVAEQRKARAHPAEPIETTNGSGGNSTAHPVGFIRQYELVDRVKAYDPDADEDLLNRAYVFAMRAHGGQTRKSGDPYFTHPLAVAGILTELKADPATVATALLHDVVEDTTTTVEEIERLFGAEIAHLVDGVTKLSKMELKSEASKQAEDFRKFVMAMADDVRVLLVKLADRLHNMRTLSHHPDQEKRTRIALETMEIYAPLAGRIGVHRFREELEHLSFLELSPDAFETISKRLESLRNTTYAGVVDLERELMEGLAEAGIKAEVTSREKKPHSIWKKMSSKKVPFEDLADIYAFRIIVNTVEECYRTLGIIHTRWRMIPTEFDDYISAPKPNWYQSIHTTVIGPPRAEGGRQRIEFQIRTRAMHETAERGVAAHWQYKDDSEKKGVVIVAPGDPYETARRLVEMFQQGEDFDEALRYAKLELFQDQVFCFTPNGRVIALPQGATPVDFAYAVHTEIGDQCVGAKINGVTRPLRTPLRNGDVVEILKAENAPPPLEWEALAVTARARTAIKRRIKKMEFAQKVALGRAIAESVFSDARLDFSAKAVRAALVRLGEKSVDEVLAKIGAQEISVSEVIEAIYPGASHDRSDVKMLPAAMKPFRPRVAIDGKIAPGVAIKIAPCCTPLPGERIVGIRQADGSIMVHLLECETLAQAEDSQTNWLDLTWRSASGSAFTQITVMVRNEIGVLSDVASAIARHGVSIANIKMGERALDFATLIIDLEVANVQQLTKTLTHLQAMSCVISAERSGRADAAG
jgi:guanosine-3',5'-bis(diphosphate) 3'-pyrophosphohydrolase